MCSADTTTYAAFSISKLPSYEPYMSSICPVLFSCREFLVKLEATFFTLIFTFGAGMRLICAKSRRIAESRGRSDKPDDTHQVQGIRSPALHRHCAVSSGWRGMDHAAHYCREMTLARLPVQIPSTGHISRLLNQVLKPLRVIR